MHKNTERERRGWQQARDRRRSRRVYVPLVVLVGSSLLLLVGWLLVRRQYEKEALASAEAAVPTSPVGSYDWDRARWLAGNGAKPGVASPFGDQTGALELATGGSARLGERSASGAIERPEAGSWQLSPDGIQVEVGQRRLTGGQLTEAGLEFRVTAFGPLVFVRRPAARN
ncbi:MAG: hypothetical protein WAT39_04910 [Planctomycetota bacterium]